MPSASSKSEKNKLTKLRIFIPLVLIALWLTGAAIGGPYFGKVEEVSSNDQTSYLPESAEATQVQKLLPEFNDSDIIPAVAVFVSGAGDISGDLRSINDALTKVTETVEGIESTSPVIPSEDGQAAQAFVPIDRSVSLKEAVTELEETLRSALGSDIEVYITGPAGFSTDLVQAFGGIDGILLLVALGAVLIILVLVYRSFLLPVAVLSTSLFALCVALLTVWWLAKAEILLLSGQTQGILFILVIGAATDYSLLYVARYREELRLTMNKGEATKKALKGSIEPILASGGTVIAGLMCLLLSDLKSNSTLGPVASIGIIFAMLAALTLLPSILYLFGRTSFWPRVPKFEPEVAELDEIPAQGLWGKTARLVQKSPRKVWVITTAALIAGAFGLLQLNASGVAASDLVLGESQARDGQNALGEHFPGGAGSPVYVVVEEASLMDAAMILLEQDEVSSLAVTSGDSASGTVPVTENGLTAFGPPGTEPGKPTVVDGLVMLQATLNAAPDSDAAVQTVLDVREVLHEEIEGQVLVGGVTATSIDTNEASIHDRNLIIPIVLAVILLILILLLRSILAPILLILTTALSFGTALGISALVFNGIFNFPGADPAVPLYGFVFLVALGIDYNIFLMTRVREESLKHGTRQGILRGLVVTGGVITSAGLVLAATFAALAVIPILFLAQLAFIVAFGVLIDTFIVRTLLVPALAYDIGPKVWWPANLDRKAQQNKDAEKTPELTETL